MRQLSKFFYIVLAVFAVAACDAEPTVNRIPMDVADVPNIHHPTAQHFTSGQPAKNDLIKLKDQGVTAVINLLTDADMGNDDEANWAQELNLDYYRVPVAGGADLTRENVTEFDRLIALTADQTTLIHCSSSNRVGAMMALRAAWHQGASTEDALRVGRDYGLKDLQTHVEKLLNE